MWAVSDRAVPRSLRMMQGFGVNTYRLVNQAGESHFVKFHWTPDLGVHSCVWDEFLKIGGQDPDFHRKDLYEAIEKGVCKLLSAHSALHPSADSLQTRNGS